MRADGEVTFFFVQHQYPNSEWVASALDHILFGGLSWDERRGKRGARYHAVLEPQQASSPLWQRFGIHGFVKRSDAFAALAAAIEARPEMVFRVAVRTIHQTTNGAEEERLTDEEFRDQVLRPILDEAKRRRFTIKLDPFELLGPGQDRETVRYHGGDPDATYP